MGGHLEHPYSGPTTGKQTADPWLDYNVISTITVLCVSGKGEIYTYIHTQTYKKRCSTFLQEREEKECRKEASKQFLLLSFLLLYQHTQRLSLWRALVFRTCLGQPLRRRGPSSWKGLQSAEVMWMQALFLCKDNAIWKLSSYGQLYMCSQVFKEDFSGLLFVFEVSNGCWTSFQFLILHLPLGLMKLLGLPCLCDLDSGPLPRQRWWPAIFCRTQCQLGV